MSFQDLAISAMGGRIIRHEQTSRNYGRLGGYLHVTFWTLLNNDPTGLTVSRWTTTR